MSAQQFRAVDKDILLKSLDRISNRTFLESLVGMLTEETCLPVARIQNLSGGWPADAWAHGQDYVLREGWNGYFCLGSHRRGNPQPRRHDSAHALHIIMCDDIGTKVQRDQLRLEPTYEIETSPGNYQFGFRLTESLYDMDLADRIGKAIIRAGLSDPGAGGLPSRYARLPQCWNSKHNPPFRCRLRALKPELSYTVRELVDGLGLELDPPKAERKPAENVTRPIPSEIGPYIRKAVEDECKAVASAPVGQRNAQLNQSSFSLGRYVGGGEISKEEAVQHLHQAAAACGLDESEADKTIASGLRAGVQEPRQAPGVSDWGPRGCQQIFVNKDDSKSQTARELFPRVPYPWSTLPTSISASLQQLARSCATSSSALPGQVLCMIAAAVGRKFAVSPKESWVEPLIFWCAVILASGGGKTGPMNSLAKVFRDLQAKEHERAQKETQEWDLLLPKDRKGQVPPMKPRGYFTTNMTLEGLHADLDGHPTGGIVVLLSELSALVNGQGEYKAGKGTDRESWLCLHDGNAARMARKSGSAMIHGGRVQVCGGIQPAIFGKQFAGQDGTFLQDGTIFRFLLVYEPSTHYPLTAESWTRENSEAWEQALLRAFQWADSHEPVTAILSQEAQRRFLDWRNDIDAMREELPLQFQGFLPKAYGYALRLAGGLYLLDRFSRGLEPGSVLHLDDINRGILAVEYFLGQALDALRLIGSPDASAPNEVSCRTIVLASVLDQFRDQTDNGRLAVGFIRERYNEQVQPEEQIKTPHAMGSLLRACGLRPGPGKYDANGRRAVSCLVWSEKIENFIEQSLRSLNCLQIQTGKGLSVADIEKSKSELSANGRAVQGGLQTLQTLKIQSLHPGSLDASALTDNSDNSDIVHGKSEKTGLADDDAVVEVEI